MIKKNKTHRLYGSFMYRTRVLISCAANCAKRSSSNKKVLNEQTRDAAEDNEGDRSSSNCISLVGVVVLVNDPTDTARDGTDIGPSKCKSCSSFFSANRTNNWKDNDVPSAFCIVMVEDFDPCVPAAGCAVISSWMLASIA